MPAFEVEWWRCKREKDAIKKKKKLVFKAERSCTSVFSVSVSKASPLQAAAAGGRNGENESHEHRGSKRFPYIYTPRWEKGALKSSFSSAANLISS